MTVSVACFCGKNPIFEAGMLFARRQTAAGQ
jgi:hypothetical protein